MSFVWASLRSAVTRVLARRRCSPAISSTAVAVADPVAAPTPPIRKRSNQPLLWTAKCSDTLRWWCGPVAVATIIGVDVAAVRDVIRRCRNGRAVKGTYAADLQFAFRHFGYDMRLLADLRSNPPTLATWARERMDMQAAYVVVVTNHWDAVRGQWVCDRRTRGVPVKIRDAPHRRKRVRFVYVVTVAPRS